MGRQGAEQTVRDGHQQGGGHPFAGDVSNAEKQLVAPHVVVVKVAAHILGGNLQPAHIHFGDGGCGGTRRQQRLLDFAGDGQLVLDMLLLDAYFVQFPQVLHGTVGNEKH